MADNTTLNPGSGGDSVRAIQKTVNSGPKSQVLVLDIGGGADASAEVAWTGGPGPGSSAIAVSRVTVGTGATLIVAARTGVAGTGRIKAKLLNTGGVNISVGNSNVAANAGYLLAAQSADDFETQAALYGILDSGTTTVVVAYAEFF